jgi:hypothetical protein
MKIYKIVQNTLFEKANFLNNNINNSNSNNKINWNAEMVGKAIWVKYNE